MIPPVGASRGTEWVLVAVTWLVTFGCLVGGAGATPTSFTLVFDGIHVADASLPAGIRHEGRFTASAPFCAAGKAADVRDIELEPLTVLRKHICDDGTGSFTALMPAVRGEHPGIGSWKIIEGTGRYATLRGIGTYTGHLLSGSNQDFLTVTYRTTWQGTIDFDAVAPTVGVTASAAKLRRPLRTYSVRVALKLADDTPGSSISYSVDIRADHSFLAYKKGVTASGQATVKLRIRQPRGVRNIQIIVTASDTVGNERTATRSLRLR